MIPKNLSQVTLQKSEDKVTGKAGLVWIYHSLIHFGLNKIIDKKFRAKKSNRQISAWEKIMAGVIMVIAGGERIEDIENIRADKAFVRNLGWKSMISPDTFFNFLRYKITGRKMQEVNEEIAVKAMRKSKIAEFTYDNDATYFNSQKKCARYSYQNEKQMSGLLGFIVELCGLCITAEYRKGNVSPIDGILEELKRAVKLAKKAGKRIFRFRADSAAHKYDIFDYCERKEIKYFITLDKNEVTKREVRGIPKKRWLKLENSRGVQWAEITHAIAKGKKDVIAMRALVLRWKNPDPTLFDDSPYCYHIIATNDWDIEPMAWLKVHNGRMGSENYNKELKSGFAASYTPSHNFQKNRTFFMINILAYNAVQIMKLFYFEKQEENWTIKTIRYKFINCCIKFVRHARKYICKIINVTEETFSLYKNIWHKLQFT
ncbi:IS1380 family transposase [Candidatus Margulisiibacteriota bacterium]